MNVMPRLRSKLATVARRRVTLPAHYRGNAVDEAVKKAAPAWIADADAADLLVFVHIPKAAGTSLNNVLWQVYGRHYVNFHPKLSAPSVRTMINRNPDQIRALGAHMPFGYHLSFTRKSWFSAKKSMFADRNCRYVTVLRNPLQRMKSYYRFVTTFPAHRLHHDTKGMSPDAFFRHMDAIGNGECCNLQCNLVARNGTFEGARDHLIANYHAVGVVDRMDDFVGYLQTTLNWPELGEIERRNASPSHVHEDGFSQDAIDWITEKNQEDMKLYQFAKEHLAPGAGALLTAAASGAAGGV